MGKTPAAAGVDPGHLRALGERAHLGERARTVPLYYDFWGFPKHYYEVTYPAPGAPALAEAVRKLLGGQVHEHADRGLDHGAYVPLVEMYPQAKPAQVWVLVMDGMRYDTWEAVCGRC